MVYIGWIVLLLLITLLMQRWLDKQYNPNQQVRSNGAWQVVLQRNRYGHYVSNGKINGRTVVFLLDTGATQVGVPGELAAELNLKPGPAVQVGTANGIITAYRTQLETVELGPLQQDNVAAIINPAMQGEEVLLGMSFLKHLTLVQQQDQLSLSLP